VATCEAPTLGPEEQTQALPVGDLPQVTGYEVLRELGRGGIGVVYKARQMSLNRLVALKMLLAGAQANAMDLVRFLAEAEAVARLDHPHIVQIHEIGKHVGLPFLSLEYVDGDNLSQQLAGTPQPPAEAARLLETLARAIHFAHQNGIVHRDLKPSNILLCGSRAQAGDGQVRTTRPANIPKITDFGLAKRLEGNSGLTATGVIMGTPSYMAPEQAEGKKEVGPAADIYALGALLYEMLTGRPPFRATTPLDTVLQVISDEPAAPRQLQSGVPRDLETIFLKCLQKDPRKRYPSAEALADDLRRYLNDRPILARPVGRTERFSRWCRRNPVVAGLLGIVAACVMVAGLLLNQERTQTLNNLARAVEAEKDLQQQLTLTAAAEQEKSEKLWQSYLDQARAGRFSRLMGQRFDSLEALSKAAQLRPDPRLRDEAIACLALPDLRPGKSYPIWLEDTTDLIFDGDYQHYARTGRQGTISVRRLADDHELLHLVPDRAVDNLGTRLSPDGRFLAVNYGGSINQLRIWNIDSGRVVLQEPLNGTCLDFAPDSCRLAIAQAGGTIRVVELATGKEIQRIRAAAQPRWLAFDAEGQQLAVRYDSMGIAARIYDLQLGKMKADLPGGENRLDRMVSKRPTAGPGLQRWSDLCVECAPSPPGGDS
jgi:serine/threonine protein kinase